MKVGCLKGSIALISHITILMIIFFGAFSPQPTASCSPGELRLYIISCERCEGIRDRVDVLVHTFPSAVMTFYEIEEENNAIRFNEISKAVGEILYMPLVGIYLDETLISVASGGFSPEGWVEAAESPVEGVTVYLPDAQGRASSIVTIADPDTLNALSRLFIGEQIMFSEEDMSQLLIIVVSAAIVDAINPCCIGVFTVLLTFIFYGKNRKAVLSIGLAFTLGLFTAYLLLGLGLGRVFRNLPEIKYMISALAIILGTMRILEASGRKVKYLPDTFSKIISQRIEGVTTPKSGLVAGGLTGFLLLPCSSAPYFIVINMIADKPSILGLSLLILYNLIIVAPFIAITMIVYGLVFSTMELKLWSLESRRWINALIGVTLVVLGIINLLL